MLVRTPQVWKDAPVRVRTPARREQEPDISDTEEESDTDAHEADMIGAAPCLCLSDAHLGADIVTARAFPVEVAGGLGFVWPDAILLLSCPRCVVSGKVQDAVPSR